MKQDANEIPKSLSGTLKFSNPAVKEETKHTPGPWQLTTIPFELRNTDSAAAIYGPMSIDGGACLIADISRSAGDAQATANARLIASAPDLLKENQELKARLKISNEGSQNLEKARHSAQLACNGLQALNAELLEALETVLTELSPSFNFDFKRAPEYIQKAQSAINKAKAQ